MSKRVRLRRCPYCRKATWGAIVRGVVARCEGCGNEVATKTAEEVMSDVEADRQAAREGLNPRA